VRESIGVRPIPRWVRGRAFIDGNEIVLDCREAEEYPAFEPDHSLRMLFDLARLQDLGEVYVAGKVLDVKITNPRLALTFASNYGLLRHGPKRVGKDECRESLRDWFVAGFELSMSAGLYVTIEQSIEENSAEPVRERLRMYRDATLFGRVPLPDLDEELLEYASIQLAERITRGLAECTPTFVAACSLLDNGAKVGKAGDFRFGNDPGSLIGAAYYTLAGLIARKERFKNCEGCGRMFKLEHGSQRFCEKKYATRKRQRELRKERSTS
jgi:hypothetical protein